MRSGYPVEVSPARILLNIRFNILKGDRLFAILGAIMDLPLFSKLFEWVFGVLPEDYEPRLEALEPLEESLCRVHTAWHINTTTYHAYSVLCKRISSRWWSSTPEYIHKSTNLESTYSRVYIFINPFANLLFRVSTWIAKIQIVFGRQINASIHWYVSQSFWGLTLNPAVTILRRGYEVRRLC